MVLRKADGDSKKIASPRLSKSAIKNIHDDRCRYMKSWKACDEFLSAECRSARRVYNFGTSTWSFLLAGYCPEYWELVSCCVIDGGSGEFLGEAGIDVVGLSLGKGDALVMGVDPQSQHMFASRFAASPAALVTWNQIITR